MTQISPTEFVQNKNLVRRTVDDIFFLNFSLFLAH
jgi:hypothetical protein